MTQQALELHALVTRAGGADSICVGDELFAYCKSQFEALRSGLQRIDATDRQLAATKSENEHTKHQVENLNRIISQKELTWERTLTSEKAKAVSEANELKNFHASARIDSDKRREATEKKYEEMREKFSEMEKKLEANEKELRHANEETQKAVAESLEVQQKCIKIEGELWSEREAAKIVEKAKGEAEEKLRNADERVEKIVKTLEEKEAEVKKMKADTSEYKSNKVKMENAERAAERWKTAAEIAQKEATEEIEQAQGELKIALTHICHSEKREKNLREELEKLKDINKNTIERLEGESTVRSHAAGVLSKQQNLLGYINALSKAGDIKAVGGLEEFLKE